MFCFKKKICCIIVQFHLNQGFCLLLEYNAKWSLTTYASDHICLCTTKNEGGFSMRDLKTYLSVAPVLSTLWFGSLAGLLIEINRFFPDALTFPFFSFQLLTWERIKKIRDTIKYLSLTNLPLYFSFLFFKKGGKRKNKSGFNGCGTRIQIRILYYSNK